MRKPALMKIFVSIVLCLLCSNVIYADTINPEEQTKKFLASVQKKDFKAIFDTTYFYQMELSKIKSKNPKVLWQKLTDEYYDSKKNNLLKKGEESFTDAWIGLGGELFGTPTDPRNNIRALMNLLTPPNKWEVLESRKEKQLDKWSGNEYDVFVVYVSISYDTKDSPLIGSKLLKEAILTFVFDTKTGLYMRSGRIEKGDVYWELPVIAHDLTYKYEKGSLLLTFKLDGGKPYTEGGKPPYKYDVFFNDKTPQDLFEKYVYAVSEFGSIKKYPLYSFEKYETDLITDNQGETRWGTFCFKLKSDLAQFTWPPDILSPVKVKIVVKDSSIPEKQVFVETTISEGVQGFPKPSRNWWIEIDGEMYFPPDYKLINVAGKWEGWYETSDGKRGTFNAELKQYLWDFGGTIIEIGSKPENIEGFLEGNNKVSFSSYSGAMKYEGSVSANGEIMEGSYRAFLAGSGKWYMKKVGEVSKESELLFKIKFLITKEDWDGIKKIGKVAINPLIEMLKNEETESRVMAACAISCIVDENDKWVIEPLIFALKDSHERVRWNAAWALGAIGDKQATEPLISVLNDNYESVRSNAAGALGEIGDRRAIEPLIFALKDNHEFVRRNSVWSLSKIVEEQDKGAVEPLISALNDAYWEVRAASAVALGKISDRRAVESLIAALKDSHENVRWNATWALGEIGDKRAIEPLNYLLRDENENVRAAAANALRKLNVQ